MPHFDDFASIDWEALAASGIQHAIAGGVLGQSFGLSVNPCIDDEERHSALASRRRSIDRKKRQCDPNLLCFLAISPTFTQILIGPNQFANTWDVFGPLIEERGSTPCGSAPRAPNTQSTGLRPSWHTLGALGVHPSCPIGSRYDADL